VSSPVTVYISDDPLRLGVAADQSDLNGYAYNLAGHLLSRYRRAITIRMTPCLRSSCDDAEIEAYVRELETGEGWIALLPPRP
jgi:hypothetical protein